MKKFLLALLFCIIGFSAFAANYSAVDSRAKRVPKGYDESLPKLVEYLVKPYQNNEEKKARALLAWIVYHIDYDDYKADSIKQSVSVRRKRNGRVSSGDLFETRVGVYQDIAELYQRMAGLAGLDSVVVTGYAGEHITWKNMEENRHAWNAVKIDGKWELVDPTWAMRGDVKAFQSVGSRAEHTRQMKQRERNTYKTNKTRKDRFIDERWFMTKPKDMIETHYPDDEKWQLLSVPKSVGSFLK